MRYQVEMERREANNEEHVERSTSDRKDEGQGNKDKPMREVKSGGQRTLGEEARRNAYRELTNNVSLDVQKLMSTKRPFAQTERTSSLPPYLQNSVSLPSQEFRTFSLPLSDPILPKRKPNPRVTFAKSPLQGQRSTTPKMLNRTQSSPRDLNQQVKTKPTNRMKPGFVQKSVTWHGTKNVVLLNERSQEGRVLFSISEDEEEDEFSRDVAIRTADIARFSLDD